MLSLWLLALMALGLLLQQKPASAAPFDSPSSAPLFNVMRRSLSSAAANLQERGVGPASGSSFPVQIYALQRRSFPAYANRRSAHPCRWKLCGAYHNYNSLRRFF